MENIVSLLGWYNAVNVSHEDFHCGLYILIIVLFWTVTCVLNVMVLCLVWKCSFRESVKCGGV